MKTVNVDVLQKAERVGILRPRLKNLEATLSALLSKRVNDYGGVQIVVGDCTRIYFEEFQPYLRQALEDYQASMLAELRSYLK